MIHGAATLLAHPRIAAFRLMGRIFTCGQLFAVSERRTLPARQQKAVEHWLSGNCKIKGWGVGGGGGAFCSWLRRCAFSSLAQSENKKWRPLGDCAAFICSCTQTTDCGAVAGIIVNILSVCVFNMVAAVFCHFYTHSILNKSNGGFNLHKLKISRNLWDMPTGGLYLTTRTTHSGLFASTVLTRESKLKMNSHGCEEIHFCQLQFIILQSTVPFYLWISGSTGHVLEDVQSKTSRIKQHERARWLSRCVSLKAAALFRKDRRFSLQDHKLKDQLSVPHTT